MVSIIIPSYNSANTLPRLIKSLISQQPKDLKYEIIVVDNGSTDQTAERLKNFPVSYYYEKVPSSYKARNKGARMANGDIFAFVDSDVYVDPKWLRAGIDSLETAEISLSKIEAQSSEHKTLFLFDSIILNPYRELKFKRDGDGFVGIFFCKKSVFDSIGGFDESLISGGDTIFGLKAKELGYRIKFETNAIVYHPVDGFKKRLAKSYRLAFGGMAKNQFKKKHRDNNVKNNRLFNLLSNQKRIINDHWILIKDKREAYEISFYKQLLLFITAIFFQIIGNGAVILNQILNLDKKKIARW
tara:strand:+ start:3094 stop:3993 length:900 start_codon:yes stop_codon:yes gene_type:complete